MASTLTVLAYLLQSIAFASLLLLIGSLLGTTGKRFPALRLLDSWRLALLLAAFFSGILGLGATAWRDRVEVQVWLELSQGPEGEISQKATRRGLEPELARASGGPSAQAREAFRLAEIAWAGWRLREAAEGYARSVQTVPTAAGYLNLGMARLSLEEFGSAESAFRAGLDLARRLNHASEVGACLDGIGRAARGQGRMEEALAAHRAALEVHTEGGNPVGRAIAHAGIASVYAAQGKPDEALAAHQEAFVLYTRLKNLLGRATALNRIGETYGLLGKPEESLLAYGEALAANREIGNLLGQARDLQGIAAAHLNLGNRHEAQDALRQAQVLYREAGVVSKDTWRVERLIRRLQPSGDEGGPG